MFNTIDEVLNYLYTQKKSAPRENLNRISLAAKLLDIKTDYKIIHVAGTNGKGSTSNYIKSILSLRGLHVGMFTSPFVISFNDRIQINDRYISNAEIIHYGNILYDFNIEFEKKYNDHLPFFELTLLMALMFFQDRKIDIAVIECGLGGLLDSTNFLKTDLAIITSIGFDHMMQLGNTLESIASHKLGIVKNNIPCLTAVNDNSLVKQFKEYGKKNKSEMVFIYDDVSDIKLSNTETVFKYKGLEYSVNMLGEYQAYNASLAIEACLYFYNDIKKDIIDFALNNCKWPGRLESIGKDIIIDGAHNIHAISALCDSFKLLKGNKKVTIVFSALQDKDYPKMIKRLEDISDKFYFTKINDLRQTEEIDFKKYTNIESISFNDFKSCIDYAINNKKSDEILLITGSLHFISMVREYYIEKYK